MKKLQLKALELGATELLSREQLRNVVGGWGSGSGAKKHCNEVCTSNDPDDNGFNYSNATNQVCADSTDCSGSFTCQEGFTSSYSCS